MEFLQLQVKKKVLANIRLFTGNMKLYLLKEEIFLLIEEHEKQVAFIKTIENQELQNSLFELLYSGK